MAALVAVMIVVAASTFDWRASGSASCAAHPGARPRSMVVTVAIVVVTHNLALGVAGGVLLAAVFFARRVAHVADVTSVVDPDDGATRIYHVTGELFFASTNELLHLFDYTEDVDRVVIDLTDAHVWDTSACAALDAVVAKFDAHGIEAELVGLNAHSAELHGPHDAATSCPRTDTWAHAPRCPAGRPPPSVAEVTDPSATRPPAAKRATTPRNTAGVGCAPWPA